MPSISRLSVSVAALATMSWTVLAQQPTITSNDYAHAERFMAYNTTPLVLHAVGRATWLPDDRFWYRTATEKGNEAVLVDAAHATRGACDLPACRAGEGRGGRGGGAAAPASRFDVPSPDGKRTAFVREWNLWLRDAATGTETALTTDGVKDFGYGTDNAGWTSTDRAIVEWSPDSKKIATYQQDQRNVGEMYLVDTKVGHPTLRAWKYPLPGDPVVTMIQRVVVDADTAKVVRLQMPPDQHRSTLCDDLACRGALGRRAVERRFDERHIRVDVAGSSARNGADGECRHRRGARCVQ